MSTDKAKIAIVKKIMSIEDKDTLRSIQEFLEMRAREPWPVLPAAIRASIDKSIAQMERGEGIPHDEVMREYKAWLKPSSGRRKRARISAK